MSNGNLYTHCWWVKTSQ